MKAWEHEYTLRHNAKPVDFTEDPSDWSGVEQLLNTRKTMLRLLWESQVPGSRAPEHLFSAMVQAWYNQGYDVSDAESLLPEAWEAYNAEDHGKLEKFSGRIQEALTNAPKDPKSPYWQFEQPRPWEEIKARFPAVSQDVNQRSCLSPKKAEIEGRILGGWLGQIVGGSYGTVLEGYRGDVLRQVYGDKLNYYIKEPETYNDDITYEIAFLAAADEKGKDITADAIADKWLELIPFGWSAEYFALENLRRGIYPPESGRFGNFFSEWIGAQMRTMVCGLVAPGDPLRAAEYAYLDSIVSHDKNGVYGGIHSAVLTSLAFVVDDTRELLKRSRDYVPNGTQFAALLDDTMESFGAHDNHLDSWAEAEEKLKTYNWIHTYPNMVAVVHALWYCENDFERALRILADCGVDVDCNAGEVGCAIGVMNPGGIDEKWTDPFNNELRTYVPGYEMMKITELAGWTHDVYLKMK